MLTSDVGIVLNKTKYGDNKNFVAVYCREHGVVSFVYSPKKHREFQALSIVEIGWDKKPKATIYNIMYARTRVHYISIGGEPQKTAVALYLADCLRHALSHEEGSEALWNFLEQSLIEYDRATEHYGRFPLVFLTQLLTYLGYAPEEEIGNLTQLMEYYKANLPAFPELKSFKVLKELFI